MAQAGRQATQGAAHAGWPPILLPPRAARPEGRGCWCAGTPSQPPHPSLEFGNCQLTIVLFELEKCFLACASPPAEPGMLCTPCVVRIAALTPARRSPFSSPPPPPSPPWIFALPSLPPRLLYALRHLCLPHTSCEEGHYRFFLSHPAPRAVVKPSAPLLNHVRHQPPLSPHPTYHISHDAHRTATECHTVSLPWPSSSHLNATPQLSLPPRQLICSVARFMLRPSVPEQHTHPPPAALSTGAPPLPCRHPIIALPTPAPSPSQRCSVQRGRSSPALATPSALHLSPCLSPCLSPSLTIPTLFCPLHPSGSCLAAPPARLRMPRRTSALHAPMHLCNPDPPNSPLRNSHTPANLGHSTPQSL